MSQCVFVFSQNSLCFSSQTTLNMKRNRPSHWSINKLITANDRMWDTCCRIETITGHQFTKIYDKRDYFNFEIVNFPFLDGDPRPLPMVYILLSLFVLQECVLMLMTSTTETYF